ncbi:MAG: outer membrane beta-barrel protein [Bacteroidia bacterium]|nr:outer membrane beta-barrel protein [Bacteroidia bacterium]
MKKVVLLAVMLIVSVVVFSQTENNDSGSKLRFGFNLGVNYSYLYSKDPLPVNAKISDGSGFSIGILMDYSISKHWIISPQAEISFNKAQVEFSNTDNSVTTYKIFQVSEEFITHLMYKINDGKINPYILIGPDFRSSLKKSGSGYTTNPDLAIDLGIGFENLNPYCIFAPELRYSYGLLNINKEPSMRSLYFHNISLILNFK